MENNVKLAANAASDEIYQIVHNKLLPHYRIFDDENHRFYKTGRRMGKELTESFNKSLLSAMEFTVLDTKRKTYRMAESNYKDYIKKPKTGLGARLKFLFSGKLA